MDQFNLFLYRFDKPIIGIMVKIAIIYYPSFSKKWNPSSLRQLT